MTARLARQLEQLAALQADTARQLEQLRVELAPKPVRRKRAAKRSRGLTPPPKPPGPEPSELDRAWARRLLRAKGWA